LAEKLNESGKKEMRNRGIGISEMDGKAARGAVRSAGARRHQKKRRDFSFRCRRAFLIQTIRS
jgi:hypothetical protein